MSEPEEYMDKDVSEGIKALKKLNKQVKNRILFLTVSKFVITLLGVMCITSVIRAFNTHDVFSLGLNVVCVGVNLYTFRSITNSKKEMVMLHAANKRIIESFENNDTTTRDF